MHNIRFSGKQLRELRELRDSGIPVPAPELERSDRLPTGILMHQIDRSSAIEINPYQTAYVVSLRIVSNLSEPFGISSFHFELPWEGAPPILLDDPSDHEPPRSDYRFWGRRPMEFRRDQVLNHLDDVQRYVSRGHAMQGCLLWWSDELVPERYSHGDYIAAFVRVVDQFERPYSGAVSLYVDRSYRRMPRIPIRKSQRDITGRRNRPLADIGACVDPVLQENDSDNLAPSFMGEGCHDPK